MLRFLLNILWLVFGGWATAISWFTSALIMVISIVGIPWARAAFNIGLLNLWPFGSKVVARETISGHDIGTGTLGFIGNVVWFIFCGWWLAAMHILCGLLFCITLIGIPVGLQHFKLAKISFAPVGKAIVF